MRICIICGAPAREQGSTPDRMYYSARLCDGCFQVEETNIDEKGNPFWHEEDGVHWYGTKEELLARVLLKRLAS